MARRLRKRSSKTPAPAMFTRRLRKRYNASFTEALCLVACGSAMARRLRSDATPAEALRRVACGSAMTRRLRRRYGASFAEAL